MQTVLICARDLNFAVVDESDYLNPIARRSVDELKQYYVMSNGGASYGHMSAKGNRAIAELIAPAVSTLLEKNGRSSKNDPAADKGQVPN
jgi:lysophospholipase L1-like esterase